jgi:hypothetical protein
MVQPLNSKPGMFRVVPEVLLAPRHDRATLIARRAYLAGVFKRRGVKMPATKKVR